ncbi:MAG: glycosyltransferase family 2 protein [Erysipelotrichaceae bacterium]|nr:glycosyltransferase family 2 protein [Erysipelotrichaceae bacterium]
MSKVSVIVPIYNVEKYVEKCLKSIQGQSLNDFECLVINDGTKDNSVEVAKKAVEGDDRFIFFDKENGGLSDARNYGVARAKGEYICFVDSDDYIDEHLLEETYNAGVENNSDIVCFDMYYDFINTGKLEYSDGANFEGTSSYKDNKEIIFINNSANNKLYKREFLSDKKFFKGMWYEDMAMIPSWLAMANQVTHVSKPLYYYVQREGSITHKADDRLFDIYKAMNMIKESLHIDSYGIRGLYFDNCLVMTTLRIKDIDDKNTRFQYYKKNMELLNRDYPNWYEDVKKEDYSFKQRTIFLSLKLKMFKLVDYIYNK